MEKIAKALGCKPEYFLSDPFFVPQISEFMPEKIAFYAGNPTEKQDEIAEKLEKLMSNIDEVMSAKYRFLNMSRFEYHAYSKIFVQGKRIYCIGNALC